MSCHILQYAICSRDGFSLRRTCGSDRRGGSRHGWRRTNISKPVPSVSIFDSIQLSSDVHSRCRLDRSSGDCSRVNTPFAGALAVPIEREIPVSIVALFRDRAWCVRAVFDLLAGPAVPNALVSHLEVLKAGPGSWRGCWRDEGRWRWALRTETRVRVGICVVCCPNGE